LLRKEISSDELRYVESVLGMGFYEALDYEPVALFLALLECYVKYVQYLAMLRSVDAIFTDLGVKPILFYERGEPMIVSKYVEEFVPSEVLELYENLFISVEGRQVLQNLISMVRDPKLRKRFWRSFLLDNE